MNKDNFSEFYFSQIQVEMPVDETYKENIPHYVLAAKAQAQITNACIYIMDYYEKKFVYITEKERIMCGYSKEEIEVMGIDFFAKILHPDDVELFNTINYLGFDFFYNQIDFSQRHNFWATYDLRVITKSGEVELLNLRSIPFLVDERGNIILMMVQKDISTSAKSGNLKIFSIAEQKYYQFCKREKRFVPLKQRLLNENEKQVLKLLSQGLANKEVADMLEMRLHTINYYNRSILDKLNVTNMKEAILLFAQRGELL